MGGALVLQLALPVWLSDEASFDSFVSTNNKQLVPFLSAFITENKQSAIPFCVLHASAGNGKSHLLYSACHLASTNNLSHAYFDMAALVNFPSSVLQGAEDKDLICIDNIDAIKDDMNWQITLFDLMNKVLEGRYIGDSAKIQSKILITSNFAPSAIGLTLPDLVSRLNWGTVFKVKSLDDKVLKGVISQKLAAKGLEPSNEVLAFLITRLSRDVKELVKVIETLDKKSLEAKRKLTIPFVKQVLDI